MFEQEIFLERKKGGITSQCLNNRGAKKNINFLQNELPILLQKFLILQIKLVFFLIALILTIIAITLNYLLGL